MYTKLISLRWITQIFGWKSVAKKKQEKQAENK